MMTLKNRLFKFLLTSVLLIVLCFSLVFFNSVSAEAVSIEAPYQEEVCHEWTLEEDFADDKVIVVLTTKATRNFKTYTPNDFPETDCSSVEDLTQFTADYAKKKFNGEKTEKTILLNVEKFKRKLSLELVEKSKENVLKSISRLEQRVDILSAEPSPLYTVSSQPNDPKFSSQWGLKKVDAPAAWDISTGTRAVTVGVLDSGIDATHPDLTNRIHRGSPHTAATTLHRDFTTGAASGITVLEPTDPNGHGTHVAGIIGAQGNNGIGIAGVAWDVRLVSLRVIASNGSAPSDHTWLIKAINYANGKNIPILNCSGGSAVNTSALRDEIEEYQGLFIAAAGNDNNNNDSSTKIYPASYRLNNLISVGASDKSDNRSNWNGFFNLWGLFGSQKSNYGATTVDIFAPGTDILSTIPGNGYKEMSGSSMSTPFVAGVAALILSIHPNMHASEVKSTILEGVDKVSSLTGSCVSGGRLNAYKALQNSHTYTNHSKLNSTHHTKKCACGSQVEEAHKITYYQDPPIIMTSLIMPLATGLIPHIPGTHTARCLPCGYSQTESHEAEWSFELMRSSCKKCGYYSRQLY